MALSKKYLVVMIAFTLGVVGAIGFSVHAQTTDVSTSTNTPALVPAVSSVPTVSKEVSDGDGEKADDAKDSVDNKIDEKDSSNTDLETKDDSSTADSSEKEGASDTGEVEDGE